MLSTIQFRTLFSLLSEYIRTKIHKIIMLSALSYGCENCSLTLREEYGLENILRMSAEENSWAEVSWMVGGWRKLRHEAKHKFHSSPNDIRIIKSRRMRWVGHVARMRRGGMDI
jgi:hypothetical protein